MIAFDLEHRTGAFELRATGELTAHTTGIYGPSGAGKSMLLALLAGLVRPDRGRIVLGTRVLCDTERGIFVPPHERGVALVFQDGQLFPHLSVRRNLEYGAGRARAARGTGVTRRTTDTPGTAEVVELLELGSLLERRPTALSGGERQRVALGRALLSGPELLLLDEPLAALDAERKRQILPFLTRVRDALEAPMLYVSHDLAEVLQLTDELVLLDEGRTVAAGKLLDLVRRGDALARLLNRGLVNVLPLELRSRDVHTGLTTLADSGGRATIHGPPLEVSVGARVHLGLRPEDVMLALEPVAGISARNQLPGVVSELLREGDLFLVHVDVGFPLLVEVSPGAVQELSLAPGRNVHCLFKSSALEPLDAPVHASLHAGE